MFWSPMAGEDMAGMEMAITPTLGAGVAVVAAWAIMMAAMMLPSAMPMIGLYAATQRSAVNATRTSVAVSAFALMYVALWALTGVPIYFASVALMTVAPATLAYTIAAVLIVAGVFQLSPLKQVCLRHCRSPLGFVLGHWRAGGGASGGDVTVLDVVNGGVWWPTFSGRSTASILRRATATRCVRVRRRAWRRVRPRVCATPALCSRFSVVATAVARSTDSASPYSCTRPAR